MATPTYELIETTTLASSASSVTFSSITQDYRDLVLVAAPLSANQTRYWAYLNNDTGSNYARVDMRGNGSAADSSSGSGQSAAILSNTVNADSTEYPIFISQIMDYSATDKHTTILQRNNGATDAVEAAALRWANTAAVTQIEVFTNLDTWTAGSTFSLYGIAS